MIKSNIAIIGYTGFVGSHIHQIYPDASLFCSSNIENIKYQIFDIVVCCGISAQKWIANKEPEQDFQKIQHLLDVIKTIQVGKFVLISTIDVYDKNNNILQDEDTIIPESKEAYGIHRFWFEKQIQTLFADHYVIVRLPALFGFGLKKNIIYDFIFKKECSLDVNGCFQWYDLQWLRYDLPYIFSTDITTINLFTEPLPNRDLHALLLSQKTDHIINFIQNGIQYNITTKYHTTKYWKSGKACYHALDRYLKNMLYSPLLISNLCFHEVPTLLLNQYGIQDIEVVPFRTFGSDFIDKPLDFFKSFGSIYSMQGLFYPHQWKLDTDFDIILSYMKKLIDIAGVVHTSILVFGTPTLRSVPNAYHLMIQFFTILNDYIGLRNITICLEPNASYYKNQFLTTCKETHDFVHYLQLQHISWMMDIGNMLLEKEDMNECFKLYALNIKHVHFSSKDLQTVTNINIPYYKYKLLKHGYQYRFTLEMLNQSDSEISKSLYQCTKTMDIKTIGCGWYGAHISKKAIEKGYNVWISERKGIFGGVSLHNQNRLHQGFHYPRSFNTRTLCHDYYTNFLNEYGSTCVSFIKDNYYFISHLSLLDINTYKQIMNAHGLLFEEVPNSWLEKVGSTCLRVNEGIIDCHKAQTLFQDYLQHNVKIENINKDTLLTESFNLILDCTYNHLQFIDECQFESSLYLIFHKINPQKEHIAFTIMDGPFFSLYPYDFEHDFYTLTHVFYGRQEEQLTTTIEKMIQDVIQYYPLFLSDFQYIDYYIATKHVMKSNCASRELQIKETNQIVSVACGKITGIFGLEHYLDL